MTRENCKQLIGRLATCLEKECSIAKCMRYGRFVVHPVLIGDCLAKMNERKEMEWKDIPGYEGLYQVSSDGHIKSIKRVCNKWGSGARKVTVGSSGYPRISLSKDKKAKTFMVHKLMQKAFKMGEGEIDHIDGNKENNYIGNLRTCTSQQNKANSRSYGESKYRGVSRFGKDWQAKITREGVTMNLGVFKHEEDAGEAYKKIAKLTDGEFYKDSDTKEIKLIMLWQKCGFTKSLQEIMEESKFEEIQHTDYGVDYKGSGHTTADKYERLKDPNARALFEFVGGLFTP